MRRRKQGFGDETVSIEDVYVKHETEKALLVCVEGEDHWVPKSQIDDSSEVKDNMNNDQGTLVVTRWIAEQKGFVEEEDGDNYTRELDPTDDFAFYRRAQ